MVAKKELSYESISDRECCTVEKYCYFLPSPKYLYTEHHLLAINHLSFGAKTTKHYTLITGLPVWHKMASFLAWPRKKTCGHFLASFHFHELI